MSNSFMAFSDTVLQTEAVVAQHPQVISSLRSTMEQLLLLAKEAAYVEGETDNLANPPQSSEPDEIVLETEQEKQNMEAVHRIYDQFRDNGSEVSADSQFSGGQPPAPFLLPVSRSLPINEQNPQPWWGKTQNDHVLGSLSFRILHVTLTRACDFLINASAADVYQRFGPALLFRTREQLLARFQWYVGPGKEYMGQLSAHIKGSLEAANSTLPRYVASKYMTRDGDAVQGGFLNGEDASYFLTSDGVCEELARAGARMVDADTLEIAIKGAPPSSPSRSDSETDTLSALETHPFIPYFTNPRAKPVPRTMKVSVPRLALELSRSAQCAGTGPVYPSYALDGVVMRSAISA